MAMNGEAIYKIVFNPANAKQFVSTTAEAVITAGSGINYPNGPGNNIVKNQSAWNWIKNNWKIVAVGTVAFVVLLKK